MCSGYVHAGRRRLVKRIYIPMPDADSRRVLLRATLAGQPAKLSRADLERLVASTQGYSGSDLAALCREAAMAPIRSACFQHDEVVLMIFRRSGPQSCCYPGWSAAGAAA